ncbi:MAG: ferritin [Firmicutes bacterium HGW-Firmicutes-10]|jgi:ferritin|nr:MAG: ferritin [Firmicutes bacterium HGW-Firmicutes-10]
MISKRLVDAINDQINFELLSSYLYLSMSAFMEANDYPGAAHFMRKQAEEEVEHAMKFFKFLVEVGARVELKTIPGPEVEFPGYLDVFKMSLAHEKIVTSRIRDLYEIAKEEKDHAALSTLTWFIDEQTEEEENFTNIIARLEKFGGSPISIMMTDDKLGARE